MKVLLLTDIPPCKNFTAGLVLDQLCRFFPAGHIACFAMIDPYIESKLSPDLAWIPIAYTKKRNERAFRPLPGRLSEPIAWAMEALRRRYVVPRLIEQAIQFGREQNIGLLWVVLQGQTSAQMAVAVAKGLNVPLVTMVWDPLKWWLIARRIDKSNQALALADFDHALKYSRACMTASWAMAREYESRYQTASIPVIASHPASSAQTPDLTQSPASQTIKLGMAGQFYSGAEWKELLRALNAHAWQIAGRNVEITVLGAARPPGPAPRGRVHYLGWQNQPDAIKILSELDVLYCPYPFSTEMEETARLSFPSKVVLYLAAGRPILFHGPKLSSPAEYLRRKNAGYIVSVLEADALYDALCALATQPSLYRSLGENAQTAFRADFTIETMRSNFEQAIGRSNLSDRPQALVSCSPSILPDVDALIPAAQPFVSSARPIVMRLRAALREVAHRIIRRQ